MGQGNSLDSGKYSTPDNQTDKFLLQLTQEINKSSKDKNYFYSPFSILIALQMLLEGLSEKAYKEILETCNLLDNSQNRFEQVKKILQSIASEKFLLISVANSLWLSDKFSINEDYKQILKEHYESFISTLNFADSEARITINNYCKEKTNGLIKECLPEGILNETTILVLQNCIYFKGNWLTQFQKVNTKQLPFYDQNGKKVLTSMMQKTLKLNYLENNIFQAVSIPYLGETTSLIIVLPKKAKQIDQIEKAVFNNFEEFMNQLNQDKEDLDLKIPKFSFGSPHNLKSLLKNIGISSIFEMSNTNFKNITPTPNCFISEALHQAFINVNEEGSEAAAVTTMVLAVKCSRGGTKKIEFNANHPFLFLIKQKDISYPLFVGKLFDPQETN